MKHIRIIFSIFLIILSLTILFCSCSFADQLIDYKLLYTNLYQKVITKWIIKIEHYKFLYRIQIVLVTIISISGILIIAVHDKKFRFKNCILFFLSLVCVSIFQVFLNFYFQGDHRLLSKIITKYDHQIENFTIAWNNKPIKTRLELEEFRRYIAEITFKLHEYDNLYYQSSDNNLISSGLSRIHFLSLNYAFANDFNESKSRIPYTYEFQSIAISKSYSTAIEKAKKQSIFNLYKYLIKLIDISFDENKFSTFENEIKFFIKFRIINIPSTNNLFKVQAKISIHKDVLSTFLEYFFLKQARILEEENLNTNKLELQKYYNSVLLFSEDNKEAQIYLLNIQQDKDLLFNGNNSKSTNAKNEKEFNAKIMDKNFVYDKKSYAIGMLLYYCQTRRDDCDALNILLEKIDKTNSDQCDQCSSCKNMSLDQQMSEIKRIINWYGNFVSLILHSEYDSQSIVMGAKAASKDNISPLISEEEMRLIINKLVNKT